MTKLTEYEEQRNRNIRDNNAMLVQLGLVDAPSSTNDKAIKKPRNMLQKYKPDGPIRKSSRFQDVDQFHTLPDYVDDDSEDERPVRRAQKEKKVANKRKNDAISSVTISSISRRLKRRSGARPAYNEEDSTDPSSEEENDHDGVLYPGSSASTDIQMSPTLACDTWNITEEHTTTDDAKDSGFLIDPFYVPVPLVDVGSALCLPPFY